MSTSGDKQNDKNKNNEGKTRTLPPRRGQVKAQIFESFVKNVTYAATKLNKAIVRNLGGGEKGSSDSSTTPPPSGYNSDFASDSS
ncbi:uncharacterized protein LOC110808571 [Carica papaya]|uniref:uncharacterized protein LOC110808571 n=1 Tax=Carica papaya TaxID=3649 RepID=UPI000B8C8973|nr:uncharacterized protein LOC110808571 [Carica papaya]XP_021889792.1 uncharacterized protein LOC110808571 [Carica papaya]